MINNVRDEIAKQFELKELGPVKCFLGFEVIRDRVQRKIFVSQESYIRTLLAKKDITGYNPAQTP